ncbi:hypothetical protein ACO22_06799, partial [Paracoccidioides brasiliensis]
TCWAMCKVTKTGLAPEINWFSVGLQTSILYLGIPPLPRSRDFIEICVVKPFDTHNLQRPELGPYLREWGWRIFKVLEKYMPSLLMGRGLHPPLRDNIESFRLAGIPLYLLFLQRMSSRSLRVVLNTEAHVPPRINGNEVFQRDRRGNLEGRKLENKLTAATEGFGSILISKPKVFQQGAEEFAQGVGLGG